MDYKDFNELKVHNLFNLHDHILKLVDCIPIMNENDYTTLKNRMRHIIEIIEKEK